MRQPGWVRPGKGEGAWPGCTPTRQRAGRPGPSHTPRLASRPGLLACPSCSGREGRRPAGPTSLVGWSGLACHASAARPNPFLSRRVGRAYRPDPLCSGRPSFIGRKVARPTGPALQHRESGTGSTGQPRHVAGLLAGPVLQLASGPGPLYAALFWRVGPACHAARTPAWSVPQWASRPGLARSASGEQPGPAGPPFPQRAQRSATGQARPSVGAPGRSGLSLCVRACTPSQARYWPAGPSQPAGLQQHWAPLSFFFFGLFYEKKFIRA